MKRHLIRSTLFVTFATSLACLLSLSTSWAQSPFIAEQPDPEIQEVMQIQESYTDWLLQIPGVVGTATTTSSRERTTQRLVRTLCSPAATIQFLGVTPTFPITWPTFRNLKKSIMGSSARIR